MVSGGRRGFKVEGCVLCVCVQDGVNCREGGRGGVEGDEVGVVGVLDQRHYSLHCSMSAWTEGGGEGGGRAAIGVGSW